MKLSFLANSLKSGTANIETFADAFADNSAFGVSDYSLFPASYIFSKVDRPAAVLAYEAGRQEERKLIKDFLELPSDWDGYDADPISQEAGSAATSFLCGLPGNIVSPDLTPNASGTITLEWEQGPTRASLEIGKRKCSFYLKRPGTATIYHAGEGETFTPIFGLLTLLSNDIPSANNMTEY